MNNENDIFSDISITIGFLLPIIGGILALQENTIYIGIALLIIGIILLAFGIILLIINPNLDKSKENANKEMQHAIVEENIKDSKKLLNSFIKLIIE